MLIKDRSLAEACDYKDQNMFNVPESYRQNIWLMKTC